MASQSLEEQLGGAFGALLLVAILITAWLAVKGTELIIRVMVAHPTNRPMWITLALAAIMITLVLLTSGAYTAVNVMAWISVAALLVTAKAVECYFDQYFQPEIDSDYLVEQVLHEPWWNAA